MHFARIPLSLFYLLNWGLADFFRKETENVLGFVDHMVSFATAQLYCGSAEVAIDNM